MLVIAGGTAVIVTKPSSSVGAWLEVSSKVETSARAREHGDDAKTKLMSGSTEADQRSGKTQMAEDPDDVEEPRERMDESWKQVLVAVSRNDVTESIATSPRNVDDFPVKDDGALKVLTRDAMRIGRQKIIV